MYLSHVEILRTSTAEPTRGAGIIWTSLKDVTHYARLFEAPGPLLVDLGNGIDRSVNLDGEFDGVYMEPLKCGYLMLKEVSVTLSLTFYYHEDRINSIKRDHPDAIFPLSNKSPSQANYFSIDESGSGGYSLLEVPAVRWSILTKELQD